MPTESSLKDRLSPFCSGMSFSGSLALAITALVLLAVPVAAQTINVIYNFPGGNEGNPTYVIPAQSRD